MKRAYSWETDENENIRACDIIPSTLNSFQVWRVSIFDDFVHLRISVEGWSSNHLLSVSCFPHFTIYLCMERELK